MLNWKRPAVTPAFFFGSMPQAVILGPRWRGPGNLVPDEAPILREMLGSSPSMTALNYVCTLPFFGGSQCAPAPSTIRS